MTIRGNTANRFLNMVKSRRTYKPTPLYGVLVGYGEG